MNSKNIIITVVIALVVGAGSFYGGMQYQKSQRVQFSADGNRTFQGRANGGAGGRFGPGGRGFTPVMGEITEADDKSITVKMDDGSSKIVVFSASTLINKSSTGTKADLKTGEKIAVFGSQNSDGSVTAQSIQLNPQMRMMQVKPSSTSAK